MFIDIDCIQYAYIDVHCYIKIHSLGLGQARSHLNKSLRISTARVASAGGWSPASRFCLAVRISTPWRAWEDAHKINEVAIISLSLLLIWKVMYTKAAYSHKYQEFKLHQNCVCCESRIQTLMMIFIVNSMVPIHKINQKQQLILFKAWTTNYCCFHDSVIVGLPFKLSIEGNCT